MMSLVGIWAPREAVWHSLLCGGDPFEHLALERRNYYGERSRNLGCDMSGHWPLEPRSEAERDLAASAIAHLIELLVDGWVEGGSDGSSSSSSSNATSKRGLTEAKLAGVVAAISAAPAHLLPHSVEVLANQLLHFQSCPSTSRAIRVWLWARGVSALRVAGGEQPLSLPAQIAAMQKMFMDKAGVGVDEEKRQSLLRSAQRRGELMEALMAERGAFQHYMSRALCQRVFGDFGYLGTPLLLQAGDVWGYGAAVAAYANTVSLEAPPAPSALFIAAGQRPLIYAAARWLQEVRGPMALVPDEVMFGGSPEHQAPPYRSAYIEAKQMEQMGLEGDNDALVRRTLLPVVTEDILLAVIATVWRYGPSITPEQLPRQVIDRAVWQFLLLLGDHRYSDEGGALFDPAPPLHYVDDGRGADFSARFERSWDDNAISDVAVEHMGDWRVDEILMPLLAAVVAAHLRSQGYLVEGECIQALMPAHARLGIGDNAIRCRPFLQACGQLWQQRGKGLAPHVIAQQMGIDADDLREWLAAQPFALTTIEELLLNLSNAGEELTFALAGGLIDSQLVRGHCIPGWLQKEIDVLSEHQRLTAAGILSDAAATAEATDAPAPSTKGKSKGSKATPRKRAA